MRTDPFFFSLLVAAAIILLKDRVQRVHALGVNAFLAIGLFLSALNTGLINAAEPPNTRPANDTGIVVVDENGNVKPFTGSIKELIAASIEKPKGGTDKPFSTGKLTISTLRTTNTTDRGYLSQVLDLSSLRFYAQMIRELEEVDDYRGSMSRPGLPALRNILDQFYDDLVSRQVPGTTTVTPSFALADMFFVFNRDAYSSSGNILELLRQEAKKHVENEPQKARMLLDLIKSEIVHADSQHNERAANSNLRASLKNLDAAVGKNAISVDEQKLVARSALATLFDLQAYGVVNQLIFLKSNTNVTAGVASIFDSAPEPLKAYLSLVGEQMSLDIQGFYEKRPEVLREFKNLAFLRIVLQDNSNPIKSWVMNAWRWEVDEGRTSIVNERHVFATNFLYWLMDPSYIQRGAREQLSGATSVTPGALFSTEELRKWGWIGAAFLFVTALAMYILKKKGLYR